MLLIVISENISHSAVKSDLVVETNKLNAGVFLARDEQMEIC
jgi:hypothetical protein